MIIINGSSPPNASCSVTLSYYIPLLLYQYFMILLHYSLILLFSYSLTVLLSYSLTLSLSHFLTLVFSIELQDSRAPHIMHPRSNSDSYNLLKLGPKGPIRRRGPEATQCLRRVGCKAPLTSSIYIKAAWCGVINMYIH